MTILKTAKTLLLVTTTALACSFSGLAFAGDSGDICDGAAASKFDTTRPAGFAGVEEGKIDADKAITACKDAVNNTVADAKNARFFFQLGRALAQKGQMDEAIAQYELAANAGHAVAMVNLGAAIEGKDPARALSLYKKSADAGNLLGFYDLGVAYRDGVGTPIDGKLALEAFLKASDLGDDVAAYNAAVLHDEGKLIPVNKTEAIRLYMLAADRNNINALFNLANSYETGDGVAADKAKALELYKKAAALGDDEAAENVKRLEAK